MSCFPCSTQWLTQVEKETPAFGGSCEALRGSGSHRVPSPTSRGSETLRDLGLTDAVLLKRKEERKQSHKLDCSVAATAAATRPRVTWQCLLAVASVSPHFCCSFLLPLSLLLLLSWGLFWFWRRRHLLLFLTLQRKGRLKIPLRNTLW